MYMCVHACILPALTTASQGARRRVLSHAQEGDVAQLSKFLAAGGQPDWADERGITALQACNAARASP